jgi:hypothetical protein
MPLQICRVRHAEDGPRACSSREQDYDVVRLQRADGRLAGLDPVLNLGEPIQGGRGRSGQCAARRAAGRGRAARRAAGRGRVRRGSGEVYRRVRGRRREGEDYEDYQEARVHSLVRCTRIFHSTASLCGGSRLSVMKSLSAIEGPDRDHRLALAGLDM